MFILFQLDMYFFIIRCVFVTPRRLNLNWFISEAESSYHGASAYLKPIRFSIISESVITSNAKF